MEPIYRAQFTVHSTDCDPYNRMKPSALLSIMQEVAGDHCKGTPVDWESLAARNLFFAITRQHVQITRLPRQGEVITVETWPGITSRVAYPRSTVCYDSEGNELFRAMSLWVLMDMTTRSMVLPGKSGVELTGSVRGNELATPGSLAPKNYAANMRRQVMYSELDRNGHMNNCRYMDWMLDLLPSGFHASHPLTDFTVSYLSEAKEGQQVDLSYELTPEGILSVEAQRPGDDKAHRVFAIRANFA